MVRGGRHYCKIVLCLAFIVIFFMILRNYSSCTWVDTGPQMIANEKYVVGSDRKVYKYHRGMPLIFIGGVPRSGTTLMRAMLDAHPEVRCGQETRVIPRLLQIRAHWLKSQKESLRLQEAGLHKEVLDSAIAAFCLEIIARHGEPAPRLCNKDPLTLKSASYLSELFPASKFILMVRDGRATVHSIISRKVTITGFDLTSYRQCLIKWNAAIQTMHNQCKDVGSSRCMMVYYEQLVLHPSESMHRILEFLEVPWNDSVLHHEEQINKPGGVPLSKVERSSDQIIKPVNLEALSKWVNQIPEDVVRDMPVIAPMLSVLGVDAKVHDDNDWYGETSIKKLKRTYPCAIETKLIGKGAGKDSGIPAYHFADLYSRLCHKCRNFLKSKLHAALNIENRREKQLLQVRGYLRQLTAFVKE